MTDTGWKGCDAVTAELERIHDEMTEAAERIGTRARARSQRKPPSAAFKRAVQLARAAREEAIADVLGTLRKHRADVEADEADRAAGSEAVPRLGFVGYPPELIAEAYDRFARERFPARKPAAA